MNGSANTTWQTELMARYPELFRQEFCGRVTEPGYPTVGDGWRDLVEKTVVRIAAAIAGVPGASLKIGQIKEKLGTLRVYLDSAGGPSNPVNAALDEALALGEARSACTCETCGSEGQLFKSGGWFNTACDYHGKGHPVQLKPGLANVHLGWSFVSGERVLRAKRYIRKTDRFEEVDPSSLKLGEG
jgi:hypothetical protein